MEITNYLVKLRKDANISQLEISKKCKIEQSRLSRIERGEIEPNEKEILSYLDALDSNEANEVLAFLDDKFIHTTKPKLEHPQRVLLTKVEKTLDKVSEFLKKDNIPSLFITQLQSYKTQLINLSDFILKLDHNITFIGDIGCGKTTAICALLDLILPKTGKDEILSKRTALTTGSGRTTLCEVILTVGENFGISTESYNEGEINLLVEDFCKQIMDEYQNINDNSRTSDGKLITDEIERAIRNMANLSKKSEKGEDGKYLLNDPAKELVMMHQDIAQLRQIILSEMKIKNRTQTTIQSPERTHEKSLVWLQKIFGEINSGRQIYFSLPKSITVFLPKKILVEDDIVVNIFDSKGIDETSIRPDIKKHLENPRTISVFCTRFNDAPSVSILELIKHRKDLGDKVSLENKSLILILPQNNEALQTKLPDGSATVEIEGEGYEIKKNQVEKVLNGLKTKINPIITYNSNSDGSEILKKEILNKLLNYRKVHIEKINDLIKWSEEVIHNFSEEQLLITQKKVLHRIQKWLGKNAQITLPENFIHQFLLSKIQLSHAQSVRATNYRNGSWDNLNYYQLIGDGSRVSTLSSFSKSINELKGLLVTLSKDEDYHYAHNFINSLISEFDQKVEQFLSEVESSALHTFSFPLQSDNELWKKCISRWGQGPNYRDEIKQWIKEWFEDNLKINLHHLVNQSVQKHWENNIIKMFNKYFSEESL